MLAAYEQAGMSAQVVPFLYDMPTVLRDADLVVARSGAMTIAELTVCGKPAILIPLPTAIYNHQLRNAEVMAKSRRGCSVAASRVDRRRAGAIDQWDLHRAGGCRA